MKKISYKIYLLLCFVSFTISANHQAKKSEKEDSLLSTQRIEEIISFLEDSQKISELKKQLKLIAEARTITETQQEESPSIIKKILGYFVSFTDNIPSNWRAIFSSIKIELTNSHLVLFKLFREMQSEKLYYKIIVLSLGPISFIISLFLRKSNKNLLDSLKKEKTKWKKLKIIINIISRRHFSTIVFIFSLLSLVFFTKNLEIQLFFVKFAAAIFIYVIFNIFIYLFLSPEVSFLSIANCSSSTLKTIKRHLYLMMSIFFFLYLTYNTLILFKLTTCARLFLMINVVILSFFLPVNMSKVKKYYLEIFHNYRGSSFLYHTLRHTFSNISLLFILIMSFLSLISLSGNSHLFYFFTGKAVYTIILFSLYIVLTIIMLKIVSIFTYANNKLTAAKEYSHNVKLKIIKSILKSLLFLVFLYFITKLWGITLENTVNSKIPFVSIASRIILIILFMWISLQIFYFIIENIRRGVHIKMLSSMKGASAIEAEKRVSTISGIIEKISKFLVIGIGFVIILDVIGVDIRAMLAGLGVIGVALGFGAQSLIKDAINGLFLIIENRIRIGDVATVNGITGQVEEINLRTIVLRSADGAIHIIPNGNINTFSNLTHEFSYYVFDIGVSYKENPDRVCQALKEVGEEIRNDEEYKELILEPLEIMGLDKFEDSAIIIKARIKTLPMKQWVVGREMNKRIKNKFDKMNIEIPFPHRTIIFGNLEQTKEFLKNY